METLFQKDLAVAIDICYFSLEMDFNYSYTGGGGLGRYEETNKKATKKQQKKPQKKIHTKSQTKNPHKFLGGLFGCFPPFAGRFPWLGVAKPHPTDSRSR